MPFDGIAVGFRILVQPGCQGHRGEPFKGMAVIACFEDINAIALAVKVT